MSYREAISSAVFGYKTKKNDDLFLENMVEGSISKKRKATKQPLQIIGENYQLYNHSSEKMDEVKDSTVALTITSPPYWNAIDYDIHAEHGNGENHRQREYGGKYEDSFEKYNEDMQTIFKEVYKKTKDGGFCCVVIGTILEKGKHIPLPMIFLTKMLEIGWEFHQDIIWNKVTGGVKRAGSFIQHTKMGYYYPNIMTEYILIFRKPGEPIRGKKKTLEINDLFTKEIANNVWHIAPVPPNQIDHPCAYPNELVRRLLLLYSQEKDIILDPFIGSGQTATTAIKNNRKVIGYDIEKTYIMLTESRIINPDNERKFNLIPRYEKVPIKSVITNKERLLTM